MSKIRFVILLSICVGCSASLRAEEEWNPSTLSEEIIAAIGRQTAVYQKCLLAQIGVFDEKIADSRHASNRILASCDHELEPIKKALLSEKVPPEMAQRYLLRKRHQAAREVLNTMMFLQSQQGSL